MPIATRLIDLLERNHAKYQIRHHPVAYTAQEIAAIVGVPGRYLAKVIVLKSGDNHFLAVLPADRRIDFGQLSNTTGQLANLAPEQDLRRLFPDCAVGAIPPFGNLYNLPTYIDRTMTTGEIIVFEGGTHSDAIKLDYTDYAKLAEPIVAEFSVKTP